jgi:hypothetical protein
LREIPFTLAPALRAHTLLLARRQRLNTNPSETPRNLPRAFQEPRALPEYTRFKLSHPFEPLNGKKSRHLEAGLSCLYLYEDEHDAPPPMNHKHEDYKNDYTHGGGTNTKTTTTTTHLRRKTPVRASF